MPPPEPLRVRCACHGAVHAVTTQLVRVPWGDGARYYCTQEAAAEAAAHAPPATGSRAVLPTPVQEYVHIAPLYDVPERATATNASVTDEESFAPTQSTLSYTDGTASSGYQDSQAFSYSDPASDYDDVDVATPSEDDEPPVYVPQRRIVPVVSHTRGGIRRMNFTHRLVDVRVSGCAADVTTNTTVHA